METFRVHLVFVEPLLGTRPGDPELVAKWIASKAPDVVKREEEIKVATEQALEEQLEKATCVFPADADGPFLWDYQAKGFFKSAVENLRRDDGTDHYAKALKACRKLIDGNLFIGADANLFKAKTIMERQANRRIRLVLPAGQALGICERPLRAQTAQGERVSLARSQMAPPETSIDFDIVCLSQSLADVVEECLDYGAFSGLGAWRNSGMGRFMFTLTTDYKRRALKKPKAEEPAAKE